MSSKGDSADYTLDKGNMWFDQNIKLTEDLVNTGELENILHDKAGSGEHANTAVLELGLTKPADVDE
jgi:hypothetical protein